MNTRRIFLTPAITLTIVLLARSTYAATPKVVVTNGVTNPVPVTVQNPVNTKSTAADNPAFQPYEQGGQIICASNANFGDIDFDVPAGKRLVIESVTVIAFFPPGQKLVEASFRTTTTSGTLYHVLVVYPQPSETLANKDVFTASQLTRGYSEAGTGSVRVSIRRDAASGAGALANVSVTGYLVDMP